MPAQPLFAPQMARDARLQIASGGAGVNVIARREVEFTQASDADAQRTGKADEKLVGGQGGGLLLLVARSGRDGGLAHNKRRTGLLGELACLLGSAQQCLRDFLQIGVF